MTAGELGVRQGAAEGTAPPSVLGPLGRAHAEAVPEHPADDGYFGPQSMVWRVHRDRGFLVAGIRALMIQALHPLAMAGVADHSDWRRDPAGRLATTSGWLLTVTYGERAAVEAAGARVRAIHTHVRGVDRVTGLHYRADDPELLLWVHMGLVDSILAIVERYGRPLEPAEADRYVAEMVLVAELVGVPPGRTPASVAALRAAMSAVTLLRATDAAREAIGVVLDPEDIVDENLRELWCEMGQVAVGTLPRWAREMYGFSPPPPAILEREPVRQLLGAVDFALESEPGVLEARRRIELRTRNAALR